ncbi:hypothetical protein [Nonomuraea fuscirosea]|uniref:hypothetical protein n=1 Tax=Nonomuraea fuscirosea TaxID=1291556 RepID=UPI003435D1B3
MDLRNDPERLDERLDEFAEAPSPRPGPVDTHDDHSDDDAQPAAPSDQVVFDQTAQLPPAFASPAPAVSLLGSDPADVQDRWHDLQAGFVDDPRDAVQRADSLLEEVTASLHQALESRIRELQDLWKDTGDHDTEQLRLALRSYRDVMQRLLPLADEPATR